MTGQSRIMALAIFALGPAGVLAAAAAPSPPGNPGRAASFAEHQKQCAGREGWSDPAPPVRIFGNVYDIGTCGITVLLVAGDKGAIVLDGATADAVPSVISNIQRLGFRLADVKLLLSSHEHLDHASGLYELRQRTGAVMVATVASKAALASGVPAPDDPQRESSRPVFRGVRVDRIVRDGEVVRLGQLELTAHTTPGHSPGGTSWSWQSCEGTACHKVVYADSVSAVSSDGYRFTDHPAYVARLRATIAKIGRLPCDLIITPHPGASDLYERIAGKMPLISGNACRLYAAVGSANLNRRLTMESRVPNRK